MDGSCRPSPTEEPSGLYELRHGASDRTHLVSTDAIAAAEETEIETAHGITRARSVVALCGERIVTTSSISVIGQLCLVCHVQRLLMSVREDQSELPPVGNPHSPPYRRDAISLGPFDYEPSGLYHIVRRRADGSDAETGEAASNSAAWLLGALESVGVETSAFDRFVIALIAREGWSYVQAVAGWLARAQLMSTIDTAHAVGIHPDTLRGWVTSGFVTPALVTSEGHYRWRLDDLKRQAARHATRPTTSGRRPDVSAAV